MADFYCIPTLTGAAKIAAAAAGGPPMTLTHYSVGDANGVPYAPLTREDAVDLVNERHMDVLESVIQSSEDDRVYIARIRIPPDVGGWNICEIGLIDSDGDLVYLANYPNNYKPTFSQGAGGELVIPVYLMTAAADTIEVVADPAVITASREWVDDHYVPRTLTATEMVAGIVQRATPAEALAGLEDSKFITSATLLEVLTELTTSWEEARRIPVGDLYLTTVAGRDPAVFWGYGTWERYAQGRVLVGFNAADADFNTVGNTGGTKSNTISVDNLPADSNFQVNRYGGSDVSFMGQFDSGSSVDPGGAQPLSNLQPYIVVAVWRRTA